MSDPESRVITGRIILANDPPKPSLMDIYVYEPLDYLSWTLFKFSIFVLFIADLLLILGVE